jgi:hypothetical protein
MTDFEAQVQIVGNGQPGRLSQLETRLFDHERTLQRLKGVAVGFGALLTCAHLAVDVLLSRR